MPSYLDYYAIDQAQNAVAQTTSDNEERKKLANLCADLMICLRTCGFYMFFLQLCGARNADRDMARGLKPFWQAAMQQSRLLENPPTTPEEARERCNGQNLTQLLLIKELTETFLAYTRYEAKATSAPAARAQTEGGQNP